MPRLLLTAFRPFGPWAEHASWLALQAVTRDLPPGLDVATRLYPVDYEDACRRLESDNQTPYDAVLHVGQASGATAVRLEQFAVNARRDPGETSDRAAPLDPSGPAAYRSALPLAEWTRDLRSMGVPAELSLHAGDYLCNAVMYWSHRLIERQGRAAAVTLVHVPLDVTQVVAGAGGASLPTEYTAAALRRLMTLAATSPADAPPAPVPGGVI